METIRGKTSHNLDLAGLNERIKNYQRIVLDLGTGDGRYVRSLAERHPDWFVIGVDSCRENLREHSRAKFPNMLFVIAAAQDLPCELSGLFSHIAINFPWGSLLESLLGADQHLMCGIKSVSRPNALLRLRLNSGALAEAGKTLESGTDRIYFNLLEAGWEVKTPVAIDAHALKSFPTTWARRLAHGRDPRAMTLHGTLGM
jgi:16S rRNA (adenine(1408)-N(1))-methyltransferase